MLEMLLDAAFSAYKALHDRVSAPSRHDRRLRELQEAVWAVQARLSAYDAGITPIGFRAYEVAGRRTGKPEALN